MSMKLYSIDCLDSESWVVFIGTVNAHRINSLSLSINDRAPSVNYGYVRMREIKTQNR